jgi:hypothetical protein
MQAASQSSTELLSRFLPHALLKQPIQKTRFQAHESSSRGIEGFILPPMMLDPLEPEDLVAVSVER